MYLAEYATGVGAEKNMKYTHITENNLNSHCTDNHYGGKTSGWNHSFTVIVDF